MNIVIINGSARKGNTLITIDAFIKGASEKLDDPDATALQISNMVRDAIKPDITMFLHYETLEENGKKIVAVDIQRGTDRPYYIAKKRNATRRRLCQTGVFSCSCYRCSDPADD